MPFFLLLVLKTISYSSCFLVWTYPCTHVMLLVLKFQFSKTILYILVCTFFMSYVFHINFNCPPIIILIDAACERGEDPRALLWSKTRWGQAKEPVKDLQQLRDPFIIINPKKKNHPTLSMFISELPFQWFKNQRMLDKKDMGFFPEQLFCNPSCRI